MAVLPSGNVDSVLKQVMAIWSGVSQGVPITKPELRSLIVHVDGKLDSTESTIVSGLPNGPGMTWIINNPAMGRWLLELIEGERRRAF